MKQKKSKKKICVVTSNRAEYSRAKSVLRAIKQHPKLDYILIVIGSHILRKYGNTYREIEKDGFTIHEKVYNTLEGENPVTMAKSTGFAIMELATIFSQYNPDIVLALTDRYETLSATIAAAFLNIPVAHIQGGEVTGTIDESIRHAITKFSHIHFPATEASKERVIKMGEDPRYVFNVGCPASDLLLETKIRPRREVLLAPELQDGFEHPKPNVPFLLVMQHPVTTEFGHGYTQIEETLYALKEINMQTIMIWPNIDAGGEHLATAIRRFIEKNKCKNIIMYRHISNKIFVQLLYHCKCFIGNSSAVIREACYFGTPAINIGSRQHMRERGSNIIDVGYNHKAIVAAIRKQLKHGRYPTEYVFGDGTSGKKIAKILADLDLNSINIQKTITY